MIKYIAASASRGIGMMSRSFKADISLEATEFA